MARSINTIAFRLFFSEIKKEKEVEKVWPMNKTIDR